MELIFTPDDTGKTRASGYATVSYSSDAEDETVVETTQENIATVFEQAKESDKTLDGADISIDAAVENPLAFYDYLVLKDGKIAFNPGHTRKDK